MDVCGTFKNKKGSSLTIFYWLAVMIVYKIRINIRNKNKRKRKGKETINIKQRKRHLLEYIKGFLGSKSIARRRHYLS